MKKTENALTFKKLNWSSPEQKQLEFSIIEKIAQCYSNESNNYATPIGILVTPLIVNQFSVFLKEEFPPKVYMNLTYYYLIGHNRVVFALSDYNMIEAQSHYIYYAENQAGDQYVIKEPRKSTSATIQQTLKEGNIACSIGAALSVIPYNSKSRTAILGQNMINSTRVVYFYWGINLESYLHTNKDLLTEFDRLNLAIQIVNQVAVLHKDNIAHLNISPAHFAINPDTGVVKLINYGHAEHSIHQSSRTLQCDPYYILCGLKKGGNPPTKMEIDIFGLLRIMHMPKRVLIETKEDLIEQEQEKPSGKQDLFSPSVSKKFFDDYYQSIMNAFINKPSASTTDDASDREILQLFFYSGFLQFGTNLTLIRNNINIPSAQTLLKVFIDLWQEEIDSENFQRSKNTQRTEVIIDIIHKSTNPIQTATALKLNENDSFKSIGSTHTHKPLRSCSPSNSAIDKNIFSHVLEADNNQLLHRVYTPNEGHENQETDVERTISHEDSGRKHKHSQHFFTDTNQDNDSGKNVASPVAKQSSVPIDDKTMQMELPTLTSLIYSKTMSSSEATVSTTTPHTQLDLPDARGVRPKRVQFINTDPKPKAQDECSFCRIG